ncbi:uncharacterized protein DEA37_0007683 [Paragonimus westermani]|uniref:Reverse transcriptase domain-containing protein n=1 Tax=Paragonimus westermani TaxID=34504 RepID=A0A5J4NQP2_9TREM|nr:uncharacterized protein DEA37_0007683 [Paragonimus westermani]
MGLFESLKQSKDPTVLKQLNGYLKYSTKLELAKVHIRFLTECVTARQYPKYFWRVLRRNGIQPTGSTLKRHALNELETNSARIDELMRNLNQRVTAVESLTTEERVQFEEYVQNIVRKQASMKSNKLKRNLNSTSMVSEFPSNPERYVHNFTTMHLSKPLLEVLSLGPKFCCPRNKLKQLDLEVQFENLYSQVESLVPSSELNTEHFKTTLVNTSYQYLNAKPHLSSILTRRHFQELDDLRRNNDILLSKPDKGAGIVLMDKLTYMQKMTNILSDSSKFSSPLNEKDKTDAIEKSISRTVRKLKQQGLIDSATFERIRPTGTIIPRLYGLPKVHKEGWPLRPILDMCNSPYHSMAQWLTELLEPVRKDIAVHSLKDTFEFVDSIRSLNVENKKIFSLDVCSLFTNVPLVETVDYLCGYIRSEGLNVGLPEDALKQLILTCTQNVQFQIDGKRYRQKDGVAMGSPLGPLLADIFMAMLERTTLRGIIDNSALYKRYMDDIICVVDETMDLNCLFAEANKAHPNLNFTLEAEKDRQISFLDVALNRRTDGSLQRGIHRKGTWNGQYTHFFSYVPLRQKRNLVRSLTHRAMRICTDDMIETEMVFLRRILAENAYPVQFVDKYMELTEPKNKLLSAEKNSVCMTLAYKGEALADLVTRRISNAI